MIRHGRPKKMDVSGSVLDLPSSIQSHGSDVRAHTRHKRNGYESSSQRPAERN